MEPDRWVMVLKPDGEMVIVPTPRDPAIRLKQRDAALDEDPGDVEAMATTWAGVVWQGGATPLRCKVNSTTSARDLTT